MIYWFLKKNFWNRKVEGSLEFDYTYHEIKNEAAVKVVIEAK